MHKPKKGEAILVTLVTGETVIGTVLRPYGDGGFELDRVMSIAIGESGEIYLDRFNSYAASDTYEFQPTSIVTTNTPIPELLQFYTTKEYDGTSQTMILSESSNAVH